MNLSLTPIISLLTGILILVQPRLLNYSIAKYRIIVGLVGIFGISDVSVTAGYSC